MYSDEHHFMPILSFDERQRALVSSGYHYLGMTMADDGSEPMADAILITDSQRQLPPVQS